MLWENHTGYLSFINLYELYFHFKKYLSNWNNSDRQKLPSAVCFGTSGPTSRQQKDFIQRNLIDRGGRSLPEAGTWGCRGRNTVSWMSCSLGNPGPWKRLPYFREPRTHVCLHMDTHAHTHAHVHTVHFIEKALRLVWLCGSLALHLPRGAFVSKCQIPCELPLLFAPQSG